MNVVGEIEGKHCIIVDDMIDTAGTLCKSAETLKEMGAKSECVCTCRCVYSRWSVCLYVYEYVYIHIKHVNLLRRSRRWAPRVSVCVCANVYIQG